MKKSNSESQKVPSFREWLATLNDAQLTQLLTLRPDTVLPLPPGIAPLAARLQIRASVRRAIAQLGVTEILVLEALAELGAHNTPVAAPEVVSIISQRCQADDQPLAEDLNSAWATLQNLALIYPADGTSFMVPGEVLHALPSGMRLLPEEASTQLVMDQEELAAVVAKLGARKRKILDTLSQSGGLGITKDAAIDADPNRPIPQLIAEGLLLRVDAQTVRLPRQVRAILQDQPLMPLRRPEVPEQAFARADDEAGAASGLEVLRLLRLLLAELGSAPASTLKGGAVGVRVINRLTKALGITEVELFRVLTVAESTRLISRGVPDPLPADDDGGDYYAPTPLADEFLASPLPQRWEMVLQGWRRSPWRIPSAAESQRVSHIFTPESHDPQVVEVRNKLIDQWARYGNLTAEQSYRLLRFTTPLLPVSLELVSDLHEEARWVGALTSMLTGKAAQDLLPEASEKLIIQADMTLMSQGPLVPKVQSLLDSIGELESAGLASVYRLTESSIRHGLDLGLNAQEILDALASYSLTELPQSVEFLINDVARRHGSVRGGPAMSYVRCDDPSVLVHAVSVVGESLAMRVIAPTVAISQAPLIDVIRALRAVGLQPVAEDAAGMRLDLVDVPARVATPEATEASASLDASRIAAAVDAIRRNDQSGIRPGKAPGQAVDPSELLATLQQAASAGQIVTLGFVDKHGIAVHRVVKPVTVSAGLVDTIDPSTGTAHRFRLHRITEVRLNP
ncbi:helicase-associated domain-containing protein [Corynebacterium epidermidicanis]|uniref:Helicase conserved C-terminal domain n=1 Tax=Corynebacterium epidermidicanis TaxID=1050174 RepID=A0A0G3GUP3_9CORY|nr:helicase-associated domain-containing protein [Corynebacterium epidermidicanis]AKK02597.1 Helicase conserved C-terminal domain [Corynebacterium epidermidicanis]